MMKKIFIAAIFVFMLGSQLAYSQSQETSDYTTSAGLRLGYPFGATVKHFTNESAALEGILGFWYGGFNITGLYEYHQPLGSEPGLQWFVGGGAEFTSWNHGGYSGGVFGLDAIIGLDYKISSAPLNLSVDWKPAYIISGGASGLYAGGGAISVRYTFR